MNLNSDVTEAEYKKACRILADDTNFRDFISYIAYKNVEDMLQLTDEQIVQETRFRNRVIELYNLIRSEYAR
jgi:hypothetical protein